MNNGLGFIFHSSPKSKINKRKEKLKIKRKWKYNTLLLSLLPLSYVVVLIKELANTFLPVTSKPQHN